MKVQFSTKSILLVTTVIAGAVGGYLGWRGALGFNSHPFWLVASNMIIGMPLWMPFVFVGYAIGRKSLTVQMVLVFVVIEAVSVGLWNWLNQ